MAILFDRYDITFAEVPDEVSLTFSITNCQGRCEGCHSPHLRENKGEDLLQVLPRLLGAYKNSITCVCFLGEGNDESALCQAMDAVINAGVKVCLYSGKDDWFKIPLKIYERCDYIKIGSYKQECGGLTSKTTNQRMYKKYLNSYDHLFLPIPWGWEDVTYKFWGNSLVSE